MRLCPHYVRLRVSFVMYVYAATGRDPVRERLLENEKNNFKLVAEKVKGGITTMYSVYSIIIVHWFVPIH